MASYFTGHAQYMSKKVIISNTKMHETKIEQKVITFIYQCLIVTCGSVVGELEKKKRGHLIKKGLNYSLCKAPREDASDSLYLPTVSLPIRPLKLACRC